MLKIPQYNINRADTNYKDFDIVNKLFQDKLQPMYNDFQNERCWFDSMELSDNYISLYYRELIVKPDMINRFVCFANWFAKLINREESLTFYLGSVYSYTWKKDANNENSI